LTRQHTKKNETSSSERNWKFFVFVAAGVTSTSMAEGDADKRLRVSFLHPDLGIGGAERLVVDAALALQRRGHTVRVVTPHHDRGHCFPETLRELYVVVAGGCLVPATVFGRLKALCAYMRMVLAAVYLTCFSGFKPDVVVVDQVSACLPVLRLLAPNAKVVFYCHFPDLLLTQRQTPLKKLYRGPIDWLEEVTTGMADKVLVNSHFTAGVFHDTFRRLPHVTPEILYPSLDTNKFDQLSEIITSEPYSCLTFLSINRYERKKELGLALKAFGESP